MIITFVRDTDHNYWYCPTQSDAEWLNGNGHPGTFDHTNQRRGWWHPEELEGLLVTCANNGVSVRFLPDSPDNWDEPSLLKNVLHDIDRCRRLRDSLIGNDGGVDDAIFESVFSIHSRSIAPALARLGMGRHEWYDPDTTYREDVRAYVDSLDGLEVRLRARLDSM